jgi:hypothetical protein
MNARPSFPPEARMYPVRKIEEESEFLSVKDRMPETLMRRMEQLAKDAGTPMAGFPIGRMKLRGDFGKDGQAKFEACNWYWGLYQRYQKIIGSKTIAPQSIEPRSKSEPIDPDSEAGQKITRKEDRILREYKSARLSALACGVEAYAHFVAVVIDEAEPDWRLRAGVVAVADAIRKHRAAGSRFRAGRRA